jgi:predicted DNA-binding transcriptional regulator YafY
MRADRLISIVMLLQTHDKMTADELSRQLEVSPRTIYRDITALNVSGIPIYTDRGPGGGIALLESYRTSLTGNQVTFHGQYTGCTSGIGFWTKAKKCIR